MKAFIVLAVSAGLVLAIPARQDPSEAPFPSLEKRVSALESSQAETSRRVDLLEQERNKQPAPVSPGADGDPGADWESLPATKRLHGTASYESHYWEGREYLYILVKYENDSALTFSEVRIDVEVLGSDGKVLRVESGTVRSRDVGPIDPGYSVFVKVASILTMDKCESFRVRAVAKL